MGLLELLFGKIQNNMRQIFLFICCVFILFASKAEQSASSQKWVNLSNKKVTVITTADKTDLRLSRSTDLSFEKFGQPMETEPCVFIDPYKTFQTMVGIGGAITDASAETFAKLPKEAQQELLKAYFDTDKGIGYSLARTNINSCDFSSGSYTYV